LSVTLRGRGKLAGELHLIALDRRRVSARRSRRVSKMQPLTSLTTLIARDRVTARTSRQSPPLPRSGANVVHPSYYFRPP
jgi:hypothetical protein